MDNPNRVASFAFLHTGLDPFDFVRAVFGRWMSRWTYPFKCYGCVLTLTWENGSWRLGSPGELSRLMLTGIVCHVDLVRFGGDVDSMKRLLSGKGTAMPGPKEVIMSDLALNTAPAMCLQAR